jgi:uncharacterized LabA/DUF88 family protein
MYKTFLSVAFKPDIMPMATTGTLPNKSCMFFIDGGYLREYLKETYPNDEITPIGLMAFVNYLDGFPREIKNAELVRVHYYDAMVDETEVELRREQMSYFDKLQLNVSWCEVKLGRCIKTKDGYRQKGVDILIAIDMLSKAYENHYDIAVLVAGDDDFVDLVRAVKDAGKIVFGAFMEKNVSKRLIKSLDFRICLKDKDLAMLIASK